MYGNGIFVKLAAGRVPFSERTEVREEEEERPSTASFPGPYGNRGNEVWEVRSDDVPCKLNNAEAKRTHQVGAVQRRTANGNEFE